MRVLITGSAGMIGGYMTRALEAEHELVLLDMREAPPAGSPSPHRFIRGDLFDRDTSLRAVEGVEAVVHLAAVPTARQPRTYELNTVGSWNLFDAAVGAGVRRVLFASTINVCGQGPFKIGPKVQTPPYLPIDENVPPRPEDCYGLSKLANEQALQGFADAFGDTHGFRAYCFRLPGVWQPQQTQTYVPPPLEKAGPLLATRLIDPWNYLDVRDVTEAFRLALAAPTLPPFAVSYLVAEETTRPEPTMELLARFLPAWLPLAGDRLPGHAPWFSAARARSDLGWRPVHGWRGGGA